jgi:hypothetical protein
MSSVNGCLEGACGMPGTCADCGKEKAQAHYSSKNKEVTMTKLHQHRLGSRPLAQTASVKLSNTVLWSELTLSLFFCCPAPTYALPAGYKASRRSEGCCERFGGPQLNDSLLCQSAESVDLSSLSLRNHQPSMLPTDASLLSSAQRVERPFACA